jgi:aryl-alcohol dehydrogenase-like predicted oxidoreductase
MPQPAIEYRLLGRTGVKVSQVSLGTMTFGGTTSEREAVRMIDMAYDWGINVIDTANIYNEGRSEIIVGKALKSKVKRENFFLATKVHGSMDPHNPNAQGNSRRHVIEQCEASLKRLNTEYLDLYQLHRPSSEVAIDETLRAFDDLTRTGKIRYFGTSTFAAWQVCEALWVSDRLHLHRVVTEQPPYNLLDRRIERELIPLAQTHGIALLPWSPLAEGFLIGKYTLHPPVGQAGRLSRDSEWGRLFYSQQSFQVVETLRHIARTKGCSAGHIALAWCIQQPGITSPIIGPRTVPQLKDNLLATTIRLTQEDTDLLDTVAPPGHCFVPYYEADFGPRLHH